MNELSLHILDICQNSIKANATLIKILITDSTINNLFKIEIIDNGYGMDEKTLSGAADPFFTTRTTRKVGLGISLFKMAAEMAGGNLEITSTLTKGTEVTVTFQKNHIDRAPLGDIEDTLSILILNESMIDIYYKHIVNKNIYVFDTREVRKILNNVAFTDYNIIMWIKNNIKEGIFNIYKEEPK
ncbi:MAG: sensor histidine kinase [Candidatus Izimaplasma sp.]|nr:sensor histidine kinase [Candidatus Izimaplasma bacterium]